MRGVVVAALRVTFTALAVAAIVFSCTINMKALAAIGGSNAAFLSAVAIMSAAVKAAVPLYREYFGRTPRAIAVVFVLAVVFDVGCALGFSAMVRGTAEARETDSAIARTDAAAAVTRLRSELAAVETRHRSESGAAVERAAARLATLEDAARRQKFGLRTAAAIRVDIGGAEARAGNCATRGHTDACQYVVRLQSELADAEGRDAAALALDTAQARAAVEPAALKELREQLKAHEAAAGTVVSRERDWFAVAISGIARDAGLTIPEAWASRGFAVLLMLFIELLAVCGLAVALRPLPATVEPTRDVQPRAPTGAAPTPLEATPAAAVTSTHKKSASRQGAAGDAVRKWLAGATVDVDGWIYTTQRAIAVAAGVSIAAVHGALEAMQTAGAVEVRAGRKGTAIRRVP